MTTDYSRESLLNFLDYLANKGLVNRATVTSRKAAVNTLLSILEPDETQDLRQLDIDALIHRFGNLKGSDFKPESLRVYRSRLSNTLEDFLAYKRDPLSFKPAIAKRERAEKPPRSSPPANSLNYSRRGTVDNEDGRSGTPDDNMSIVFPIPIRPGIIVKVAGIPSDLTPEEAEKIGRVILALSGSQEH